MDSGEGWIWKEVIVYYTCICLKEVRNATKNIRIARNPGEIRNTYLRITSSRPGYAGVIRDIHQTFQANAGTIGSIFKNLTNASFHILPNLSFPVMFPFQAT